MSETVDDAASPRIVLDTNVCLDLFVFRDPAVATLREALDARAVVGITAAPCRDEWQRVLTYPVLRLDESARVSLLAEYDSVMRGAEPRPFDFVLPRCEDPDDQKFLELAAACGARWLLSRDDALLKLARRTRREGWFDILSPGAWADAWRR